MCFATGWSCFTARPPKSTFTRRDGTIVPKFVYLDMEEYRDKTSRPRSSCERSIARASNKRARASRCRRTFPIRFVTQQRINDWARNRVAAGGSPVTIRIVKGANMEAERVEASIRGWPQAPYKTKLETDANYLRMLHEGMQPENLAAVRLGIASHNLFTLAYGLVLATKHDALDRVQFEMLEGMANHQRRALLRAHRQHAPLRAGLQARRLHQRHRLPRPPPRRKHRPRQFPPPRLQHRSRQRRLERHSNNNSSPRSKQKTRSARTTPNAKPIKPRQPPASADGGSLRSVPQRTRHRLVPPAKRQLGDLNHRQLAESPRFASQ